jgi:anaerobic selenocysteine-containing dehydrogenase
MLLAIANYLIQNNLYNREFVERWWNWEEFLTSREAEEGAKVRGFYGFRRTH